MAELKPAYLVHGDDHGALAERRAGLRARATREGGAVEVLEGEAASPAGVARALAAMTLTAGRRVILVEGVERWRASEVETHIVAAMSEMHPDTTLALFAREDARVKAPAPLHEAVRRAGGQVLAQANVKPWELAKWVQGQAARMGLSLDQAAAKALVDHVGERQQRLLRELEKLALDLGSPSAAENAPAAGAIAVGIEEIDRLSAPSSELKVFALADALVASDARRATLSYMRLRQQGERVSGLTYLMAQRLREGLAVALRLQDGVPAAEVRRALRMPSRVAERFVADVARADPERLRRASCALAELELDSRGGAPIGSRRSAFAALGEDTLALRAIAAITD